MLDWDQRKSNDPRFKLQSCHLSREKGENRGRCQSTNIYHNRTVHHSYWRQAVVASFTTAALQNAAHTRRSAKSDFETIRWIQRAQLLELNFYATRIF